MLPDARRKLEDWSMPHGKGSTMPEIFGAKPQPRVLIHGFIPRSPIADFTTRAIPTYRFINEEDLGKIRQAEWDLVVTRGDLAGIDDHLYVLQFGGGHVGKTTDSPKVLFVDSSGETYSTHFTIPDEPPSVIRTAVREHLLPEIQGRAENPHWRFTARSAGSWVRVRNAKNRPDVNPFLLDADAQILAGRFIHENREIWWIPDVGSGYEKWLEVALGVWAERDSEKFPVKEEWKQRVDWQTPEEAEARSLLEATRTKLLAAIDELKLQESSLSGKIQDLAEQVDRGDRRLLTDQGDELVDQVANSLSELGFSVTDVDKEIATPGDRREDLRVSLPEADWIAIVEVRGYARGAQLNDLLRIGRFVTRYTREKGEEPSAAWYVVNQELKKDPDLRQLPLASNAEETATFAEDGGLVMDTRDLFRLTMAVRRGRIDQQAARQLLIDCKGRFAFPVADASA